MDKSDKSSSPMGALLGEDQIPSPPVPGNPVTGKVVNIQNGRILVEIDGTYTGIISGRETVDGFDTAKKLSVGDEVTTYVVEDENDEGYYILSLRKAGRESAWERLAKMKEASEAIEVSIKEANKGGLMTEFSGIRAFIPVSQLSPEHYPRVSGANSNEILSRLQKYVGQKFTVQVLTAEPGENKLIFSEKAGLAAKREATLKKLKVGDKVTGKVTGVVNFGIFILFNECLEGLVHLSEIAWGKVTDAANYARIGEEKEAVVIGIDTDKISLSVRRLTPDPWLKLVEKYSVGDEVEGEVSKITSYGALVALEKDLNGLLHASEISKEGEGGETEIDLEVGDKVKAKIIEISPGEHRIGLSIKELGEKAVKKAKSKSSAAKKEKQEAKDADKDKESGKKKEEEENIEKDKENDQKEEQEAKKDDSEKKEKKTAKKTTAKKKTAAKKDKEEHKEE
ncbi:MAG: S1 RNA-binding domain-containing protein [Patescibacteria group bacterium]